MTEKKSIVTEIIERRIPQILGVYVASVWLAVEIADWMSERFDVPVQLSSYVFVIMIAFVPLVALLAWGHGRPGKDKWTQKQLLFIPINVALAYFAVTNFIKPTTVEPQLVSEAPTEIMALTDVQTGKLVEYEVAKSGLNQKVTGFFWENKTGDESLDWLSYGSMWMVAKDLMRNPILSIRTPYDSGRFLRTLTDKGFASALGSPLSLKLDIANDQDAQWMINGEITKYDDKITFEASLYDVLTGALVTKTTSSYDDLLFALDDVAEQLASVILEQAKISSNIIPQMPISEYISSNLSAIESVVNALNAITFDNDFSQGVIALQQALEEDAQMAEAYMLLMDFYRAMGDVQSSIAAANNALKLEYKLVPRDALKVKANFYAVQGEFDKAVKVLENWVKLEPESADALEALGGNYIFLGNHLDEALEVYTKLSEIQKSNATALLNQARIYRLKDNPEMAIKALSLYAENEPEEVTPWLEKGETYLQFGDIENAKKSYEEASLLSFNQISADLALAKIMALEGDLEGSLEGIDRLVQKAESDSAKVQILGEKEQILFAAGRVSDTLKVVLEAKVLSESYMPPIQYQMTYGSKETTYLAYTQDFAAYEDKLAEVKAQLKPPFDDMMWLVEVNVNGLRHDYEKMAAALVEFEQFAKIMKLNLYDQFILQSKAVLARSNNDFDQAIALHDEAIKQSKQSFVTLNTISVLDDMINSKAQTLLDMEAYEEVIRSLAVVIKRNPMSGQAKLLAAKAHLAMKQYDEAQQLLSDLDKLWAQADKNFKYLSELEAVKSELQET